MSVRLNEKGDALIRKYAQMHNMNLSSFIRQAVIEKIEDEYDLTLFNKVCEEEKEKERFSHEMIALQKGQF
ncbi:MAG: type II toxin-antitoxin system RelB family antitoxin [Thermotogota bacterium]